MKPNAQSKIIQAPRAVTGFNISVCEICFILLHDKDLFNQITAGLNVISILHLIYLTCSEMIPSKCFTLHYDLLSSAILYLSSIHQLCLPLAFKWVSELIRGHFRVVRQWVFWRGRSIIELTSLELFKCSLNCVSLPETVSSLKKTPFHSSK